MNPFSISRQAWKWTKKPFYHFLEFTILSGFIILSSCGYKLSQWPSRYSEGHNTRRGESLKLIRQDKTEKKAASISQLKRLDTRWNNYRPLKGKTVECCARSAKNKGTETKFRCPEWNVGLCASMYCEVYHTKLYFWEPSYTKLEKWSTQT